MERLSRQLRDVALVVLVALGAAGGTYLWLRPATAAAPAGGIVNPQAVVFTSPDHAQVARYELDVLEAPGGTRVQTLTVTRAETTVGADGFVEAPLAVLPLQPGPYRVVVRAVAAVPGTSAEDTRVPPAPAIVDTTGAVWTLGADGLTVLRNGQNAGGRGTVILWHAGGIYTLGTDGAWWQVSAGGGWASVGTADPAGGAVAGPGTTATSASSPSSVPSPEWIRGPIAVF